MMKNRKDKIILVGCTMRERTFRTTMIKKADIIIARS